MMKLNTTLKDMFIYLLYIFLCDIIGQTYYKELIKLYFPSCVLWSVISYCRSSVWEDSYIFVHYII